MITYYIFVALMVITFNIHINGVLCDQNLGTSFLQKTFYADQVAMESNNHVNLIRMKPDRDWSASIYNSQRPLRFQQHQVSISLSSEFPNWSARHHPAKPLNNYSVYLESRTDTGAPINIRQVKNKLNFTGAKTQIPHEIVSELYLNQTANQTMNATKDIKIGNQSSATILNKLSPESILNTSNGSSNLTSIDAYTANASNTMNKVYSDSAIASGELKDLSQDLVKGNISSNVSMLTNMSFAEFNGSEPEKPCSITIINYINAKDAEAAATEQTNDRNGEIAIVDHVYKNQGRTTNGNDLRNKYSTTETEVNQKSKSYFKNLTQQKNFTVNRTQTDIEPVKSSSTILQSNALEKESVQNLHSELNLYQPSDVMTNFENPSASSEKHSNIGIGELLSERDTSSISSTAAKPHKGDHQRFVIDQRLMTTQMPLAVKDGQAVKSTQGGNEFAGMEKEPLYTLSASQLSQLFANVYQRSNMMLTTVTPPQRPEPNQGFGTMDLDHTFSSNQQNLPQISSPIEPINFGNQDTNRPEMDWRNSQRTFQNEDISDQSVASKHISSREPNYFHLPQASETGHYHFPNSNSQSFRHQRRMPNANLHPFTLEHHHPIHSRWHRNNQFFQNRPHEIHYVIGHNQESD